MTPFDRIRQDILQLSCEEKEVLVHLLQNDLEENRAECREDTDNAWREEIARRIPDTEAGQTMLVSLEEVLGEKQGTMKAIYFHPAAREELNEAASFFNSRGEGAGDRFRGEVSEMVNFIYDHPQRSEPIHLFHRCELKHFPYTLYYREVFNSTVILAVAHNRQKPGNGKETPST